MIPLKQIGEGDLRSGKFCLTERQIINLGVFKFMVVRKVDFGSDIAFTIHMKENYVNCLKVI